MFKVKSNHLHDTLCVLRVNTGVLDLPNVVIADENAASDYVRFTPAPTGLANIVREIVFAESWKHPGDQIAEWRHGSATCAEVLVPDRVPPDHLVGAYTSCEEARTVLAGLVPSLAIVVNSRMFFQ